MMWARCLLLCLTHQTYAKSHYPSLNELCSKSAHRAGKHESVDIYRRPQCLHTGSYYKDVNGALLTNATGFYSYNDVAHWDQDASYAGWSWQLPSPCDLQPSSESFFCKTLHAFYEKQLRNHPRQEIVNSSLVHEVDTSIHSPRDAILPFKRPLAPKDGQPPVPPRCDLNTGKFCHLDDGSIHPAVPRGVAYNAESGCGHAEERIGPHVVMVGDSIAAEQFEVLFGSSAQFRGAVEDGFNAGYWQGGHVRTTCGVHVSTYRSNRLQVKGGAGPNPCWVRGVCRSDVAIINYGAHASGIERFTSDFKTAVDELENTCGDSIRAGRPKVFFRTTPEGNPWCNTKLSAQENNQYWNMSAWSNFTWGILSGKKPPPDNLFKLSWSWGKFQAYNMIAAKMLAPLGVQMLDVVPMTRLRPTVDWNFRTGNNLDCLHGNPAVHEWNNLFINALAADMCFDEAPSTS